VGSEGAGSWWFEEINTISRIFLGKRGSYGLSGRGKKEIELFHQTFRKGGRWTPAVRRGSIH